MATAQEGGRSQDTPTEEENIEHQPKWKFWKRRRYTVGFLAFCGYFNSYALRGNLSIAVVAMTDDKPRTLENSTVIYEREFQWDSIIQSQVLAAFFYGYITTMYLGGWISARIGGVKVFAVGVGVPAIFTLLTPLAAAINVYLLIAVRVLVGIFQGVTYPCNHAVWSRWAPPLERSKLVTIAYSGSYFGIVVTMVLSAQLASAWGWESIFYFFGVLALVWTAYWSYFVTESPADDPRISKDELEYIQKCLGDVDAKREIKIPWAKILTSLPFWSIIVSHFVDNWSFYLFLAYLPTFMKDMFNYDLNTTGFLACLPYLAMAIMMQFSGQVADYLREKKILTTTQVRKLFNCGAFVIHAIFMVAAVHVTSVPATMFCLVMATGVGVFAWSGFGVNYLDIAPIYSSILMGFSNTICTLAGILPQLVTGRIVVSHAPAEWRIVFYICAVLFLIGTVMYAIFASGEVQPWAVKKHT